MAIKIESGIPIPIKSNKPLRGYTEALRTMNQGDSFLVPDEKCATGARSCARAIGTIVKIRKMDSGEYRVWKL